MKVIAEIIGLDNDYPMVWKEGNVLPSSGDSIWMDGYLSDKTKELLDKVMSKDIWDACRIDVTALDTLCEEEMLVKRRGFFVDGETKEMICSIVLTYKHLDLLDAAIDVNNCLCMFLLCLYGLVLV
ncbi:hypothetical protein [Phocaeicola sp.]